jgi:thiamine-monophosphate kinase
MALEGKLANLPDSYRTHLARRYATPRPRTSAAKPLRELAHAAIDVSDGLIADAGHIARASNVRLMIDAAFLPLSSAAQGWLEAQPDYAVAVAALATGGDDYEILFCAPEDVGEAVAAASGVRVTRIGWVVEGTGVRLNDRERKAITIERPGYTHF